MRARPHGFLEGGWRETQIPLQMTRLMASQRVALINYRHIFYNLKRPIDAIFNSYKYF